MKLLRLKITDPKGFRSLPCGFEHYFRTEWTLQEELALPDNFAPFVCAGPNGSGKSNVLEVLAAIFYQLEILRVRRSFLPEALQGEDQEFSPSAFELDYRIRVPDGYRKPDSPDFAHVCIKKELGNSIVTMWQNQTEFDAQTMEFVTGKILDILIPQYVIGYSSGENEILSLPFFKMRFIQFDEYWNALTQQLPYPGYPETRMAYLDNSFSQAILLCNLLFQDEATLQPFHEDIGIEALTEFRIILRRSISINAEQLPLFDISDIDQRSERQNRFKAEARKSGQSESDIDKNIINLVRRNIVQNNSALKENVDEFGNIQYRLNLLHLVEGDEKSSRMISALKRCATLVYEDEVNDTMILDYWVNHSTKQAFRDNFDNSPLSLFQALQVLLTLNLYTVSDKTKTELYESSSFYVNETVPTLASDKRIMRIKNFYFTKQGSKKRMLIKELSDGEHQLLHSLGLCLLFRNTNSLILLDEPETHFNPSWRASFISQLKACLGKEEKTPEMLITTHSPFLISDSKQEKVLIFKKDRDTRHVKITHPDYNTFGASINKITMSTFNKRETIGGQAQQKLDSFENRLQGPNVNHEELIREIDNELGDSVEKILLINKILDAHPTNNDEVKR